MLTYAESDKAQANTAQNRIFHKYLRENELLSKTNLAYLLGAQMVSIHEIKKSRDTAPLKGVCHKIFNLHFFMIWTHLGPWWTSIFEFGFNFANIFDHKVRKIQLGGVHDTVESKY